MVLCIPESVAPPMARPARKAQAVATVTDLPSRRKPAARATARSKPAVTAAAPVVAPPASTVEEHVAAMAIEHIQCRDFGHSWRPFSARIVPAMHMIREELRCARCTTIRVRDLGMRGQLLASSYDYVDGYTRQGMGRLTGTDRDLIRLASVQHLLKVDTVQE
jgi:hypothetical protein